MSEKSARRLRVSSKFTCSRCGGREAYCCQGRGAFERYVLNMVMVQAVRCCDCDALCYAFPVLPDGHILGANKRIPVLARAA